MKISKLTFRSHLSYFDFDCFPRHFYLKFYKLNHKKLFYFFFQLAMNQMITFNTS
jgi:hypothetical protein